MTLLGGTAAAWPVVARAQQQPLPTVGFLSGTEFNPMEVDNVKAGLAAAGYRDGENVHVAYLSAKGQYELLPSLAKDLARRQVAVIVAIGGTAPATAAKSATTGIPIVFAAGGDPVKLGLVQSLNRPGGFVTGVSFLVNSLGAKRVEMLHLLVPSASLIGLLVNPDNPNRVSEAGEIAAASKALGLALHIEAAAKEADIAAAFSAFSQQHIGAFTVVADAYLRSREDPIVALAAKYAMPAVYPREEYATAGGLMSYAPRPAEAYRIAGSYVARILKGEQPSELPVQQSDKVYLTINLKTAKALGLAVPAQLLALADKVIE